MGSGSFTGQNGSFTASSLTRHFLAGSPMSFRAGSFGSRFYPGVSPGQLLGPLDPNDFKFTKMSSSVESDRGPIVNALAMLERQDELCRDYTCCGLNLTDLHALVEHFEECHVVVLDPYAPQQPLPPTSAPLPAPAGQQAMTSYYPDANAVSSVSSQQQPQRVQSQRQPQSIAYQGFDPDDMELDVDQTASSAPSSGAPSPPDTPITTPLSGYPSPTPSVATYSAAPSPHHSQPASPISAFDTTTVLPSRGAHHHHPHHHPHHPFRPAAGPGAASRGVPEDAFNAYAGYADYSSLLPGTTPLGSGSFMQQSMVLAPANGQGSNGVVCAPTALLLSGSAGNTPDSTPASSRVASPIPGGSGSSGYRANAQASSSAGSSSSSNPSGSGSGVGDRAAQTARASTTLSRPASSLLLSKPFKCPKPNCNKSYKQANGLKYHMTHGSCNFAPPKDLEHLQELLASKRSEKAAQGGAGGGADGAEVTLSDAELREVEKEAERRLRPYACGVGECQRRYKNMNGLRYHYQHSGDHGAIGLALLASGQHECLQHNKSRHATPSNSHSNSNSNSSSVPSTPQTHSRAASQHSSPSLAHQQAQPQPQPQPQYATQQQQPPTYQSALASPPAYSYQPNAYVPQQYAAQHYMPQS